jgi:hypothetical protein
LLAERSRAAVDQRGALSKRKSPAENLAGLCSFRYADL